MRLVTAQSLIGEPAVCNCFLVAGHSLPTLFMSEYDIRPGGSLKLKGGVIEGGIVKKWALNPPLTYWLLIALKLGRGNRNQSQTLTKRRSENASMSRNSY